MTPEQDEILSHFAVEERHDKATFTRYVSKYPELKKELTYRYLGFLAMQSTEGELLNAHARLKSRLRQQTLEDMEAD